MNDNPFAAPTAYDEAPEQISDWTPEDPTAMSRVRAGLLCVYIAICGILLTALGGGAGVAMADAGGDIGVVLLLGTVISIAMLVLGLLYLIGIGFCINIPREANARLLAIAALVLQLLVVAIAFGSELVPLGLDGEVAVVIINNLLSVASVVSFLLFMWRTAEFIGNESVAGRAKRAMAVGIFAIALLIAGVVVSYFQAQQNGRAGQGALLASIGGIACLVALIMYANTVTYLRKAISETLKPR